jgi:hypothetical protein
MKTQVSQRQHAPPQTHATQTAFFDHARPPQRSQLVHAQSKRTADLKLPEGQPHMVGTKPPEAPPTNQTMTHRCTKGNARRTRSSHNNQRQYLSDLSETGQTVRCWSQRGADAQSVILTRQNRRPVYHKANTPLVHNCTVQGSTTSAPNHERSLALTAQTHCGNRLPAPRMVIITQATATSTPCSVQVLRQQQHSSNSTHPRQFHLSTRH